MRRPRGNENAWINRFTRWPPVHQMAVKFPMPRGAMMSPAVKQDS